MRLKKPGRTKNSLKIGASAFEKGIARVKDALPFQWDDGATTIMLVAIGVSAAVMLGVALRSGEPSKSAAAAAPSPAAPATARVARAAQVVTTPEPKTAAARPATSTAAVPEQGAPVTLTGCLEQDNDAFRLNDTSGANAPKARSWKSGFLKKKSASIAVIDRANTLKLPDHVGERVVVTGRLVDREMQVRSLRRVATSCNEEA